MARRTALRVTAGILLAAILTLVSGCGVRLAVPEIIVPEDTVGKVVDVLINVNLPQNSPLKPDQLTAVSIIDSSPVGPDGKVQIKTIAGSQVITFVDQAGNVILLGYVFFRSVPPGLIPQGASELDPFTITIQGNGIQGSIVLNSARSTALALIEINPLFLFLGVSTQEELEKLRREIATLAIKHPRFEGLTSAIKEVLENDPTNLFTPGAYPDILNLAKEIARDIFEKIVGSIVSQGNVTTSSEDHPYLQDLFNGTFKFINQKAIYYGVVGYDYDNPQSIVQPVFILNRKSFSILPWNFGFQNGERALSPNVGDRISFHLDGARRELSLDPFEIPPHTAAGLSANVLYIALQALCIKTGIACLISDEDLVDLYNDPEIRTLFADFANTLVPGLDEKALLENVAQLMEKSEKLRDALARWIVKKLGKTGKEADELIDKISSAAKTLSKIVGGILKALNILEKGMYFYDLINELSASSPVVWNIQKTNSYNLTFIPQVQLHADRVQGNVPLTVNFTANASDLDGTITSYEWDFEGDGITDFISTNGLASHTYQSDGTFNATVKVIDNDNAWAQDSVAILVTGEQLIESATFTWQDPSSGGQLEIEVNVFQQATGQYRWEYTIRNVDYDPPGGNGLSGFQVLFASQVEEFAGQFGPPGWSMNCCGAPPPWGAEWDISDLEGEGIRPGSEATFGFITDPRAIVLRGDSWAHTWISGVQQYIFSGDLLVPGSRI